MCDNKRKSIVTVVKEDGREIFHWRWEQPHKAMGLTGSERFLTQDEAAQAARIKAMCEMALYECVQCGTQYDPQHYGICPTCAGLRAPSDWPTYAEVQVICANCGEAKEDEHEECDPFWTGREALRDWWAGGL
jgi:hypothetical protein